MKVLLFLPLTLTFAVKLDAGLLDGKSNPVARVVTMLRDMGSQLQLGMDEDQKTFDKMTCWCDDTRKDETENLRIATLQQENLQAEMTALSGAVGRLNAEIVQHRLDLQNGRDSLKQAAGIREQQSSAFNDEEKGYLESISSLQAALTLLMPAANNTAFIQARLPDVTAKLRTMISRLSQEIDLILSDDQKRAVQGFLAPAFLQAAPYQTSSGELFGIFEQMLVNFQDDLSKGRSTEAARVAAYQDLTSSKSAEIAATADQLNSKLEENATKSISLQQHKVEISASQSETRDVQTFLASMEEDCSTSAAEFTERKAAMATELKAVKDAADLLDADAAHGAFSSAFANQTTVLLQVSSSRHVLKEKAIFLQLKSVRHHSQQVALAPEIGMSAIAMSSKTSSRGDGKFDMVIDEITHMKNDMLKQSEDDTRKRDSCVKSLHESEMSLSDKNHTHTTQGLKLAASQKEMNDQMATIQSLQVDIQNIQKDMEDGQRARASSKAEFETSISDQQEAVILLTRALDLLTNVYMKTTPTPSPNSELLQVDFAISSNPNASNISNKSNISAVNLTQRIAVNKTAPVGFKTYQQNSQGFPVLKLLNDIIHESKMMQEELTSNEKRAVVDYQDAAQRNQQLIVAKTNDVQQRQGFYSKAEAHTNENLVAYASTGSDIQRLESLIRALHNDCDFLVANYEGIRQGRDKEMDGLEMAQTRLQMSNSFF